MVRGLDIQRALIEIGSISAEIDVIIVPDQYLKIPITLGQTFIERPNVIIYTTNEELLFLEAPHWIVVMI